MVQKAERASAVNACEKGRVGKGKKMTKWTLTLILCLVWVGLARAHGDVSKLPDSVQITQYRLGLYISPDDLATHNKLAIALYRTGQLEEAKKELKLILEKDCQNFDALDGLGIALIRTGKYQEALDYLKRAVKINEQDVMVHVHLSAVYQKMNLPEKAQSELARARALTSDSVGLENIEKELKLVTSP